MRKKREKEVEAKKEKRAKNEANTNVNVIEFGSFTRRSVEVEVWLWPQCLRKDLSNHTLHGVN